MSNKQKYTNLLSHKEQNATEQTSQPEIYQSSFCKEQAPIQIPHERFIYIIG